MREIVLDTETTGLDPAQGHRIIEICGIELENHLPTDKIFHTLVNPERDIPEEATRVHGITGDKLANAPLFAGIADDFIAFIGDAPLVIHNAEFDLKFLNAELERLAKPLLPAARSIDTIKIAKRRFPGARYSLDELCRRFNIDLSVRALHSAKVDTELLAQVYLELLGGRQADLQLAPWQGREGQTGMGEAHTARKRAKALPGRLSAAECESHHKFVAAELKGDVLWSWGKT
nr:MAG: DNA polymerase III subunit epsilon [Hyphomicrobiales bacterium]